MSASGQCPHPDVHFHINHHRSGDSNTHYVELKAACKVCLAVMVFPCPAMGMSPEHPAIAPDGEEIRIPMRGRGEDPAGSQLGFSIVAAS